MKTLIIIIVLLMILFGKRDSMFVKGAKNELNRSMKRGNSITAAAFRQKDRSKNRYKK